MMGGFGGSMGGVSGSSKAKRPINVKFEIPYFTTSGIQVRYLKIIEPKVGCSPGIRRNSWKTCADRFLVAISFITLGAVHHSVGRHRGQIAGCAALSIGSLNNLALLFGILSGNSGVFDTTSQTTKP